MASVLQEKRFRCSCGTKTKKIRLLCSFYGGYLDVTALPYQFAVHWPQLPPCFLQLNKDRFKCPVDAMLLETNTKCCSSAIPKKFQNLWAEGKFEQKFLCKVDFRGISVRNFVLFGPICTECPSLWCFLPAMWSLPLSRKRLFQGAVHPVRISNSRRRSFSLCQISDTNQQFQNLVPLDPNKQYKVKILQFRQILKKNIV